MSPFGFCGVLLHVFCNHFMTKGVFLICDALLDLSLIHIYGKAVCVSDSSMEATQRGPIRQNDLQQGEVYDARLEGKLSGWHSVKTCLLYTSPYNSHRIIISTYEANK